MFAASYSIHGFKHDNSLLEKDAEKGRTQFIRFRNRVNHKYGKNYLEKMLSSSNSSKWKIDQINKLWKEFR